MQLEEKELLEIKKKEKYIKKNIIIINTLGILSLIFSCISLFLILILLFNDSNEDLIRIGLVFSIVVFSLIGLIFGLIGFLKAKIIRKSGTYVTSGIVLNLIGEILNGLEIFLFFVFIIIKTM